MLRGILDSQNFELYADTGAHLFRARPKAPSVVPPRAVSPTDMPSARASGGIELFVLALKHMRAVDIATTLNALYGRASNFTDGRERPALLGDELRANRIPPVPMPADVPNAGARLGVPAGEMTIVPDAHANRLLIRASRYDFDLIRAVVDQLDIRQLQVMIEVLIVEVQRDRTLTINVNSTLKDTKVGEGPITLNGQTGSTGVGDFALKVMGIGGIDLNATLSLAAARGDARILSTLVRKFDDVFRLNVRAVLTRS